MKVLLTAHACHPEWVSEHTIGWRAMMMVAKRHHVWLLTSERCREGMEAAMRAGRVPKNIHVHYAGPSFKKSANPMLAKLSEWPYYKKFLRDSLPIAQNLHREVGFDLVHHVTFATWRVGVPYWRLGVPLVWGPIGGGEQFDLRYLRYLSPSAACFEVLRYFSNLKARVDPEVRKTVRKARVILISTPETEKVLGRSHSDKIKFRELSVTSFPNTIINNVRLRERADYEGPLRLFGAGTLEGRKGVALVIEAMKELKQLGRSISYRFCMGGPESEFLRAKVRSFKLDDCVQLTESPPRAEYEDLVKKSHIYLLPSLRDNSPVSLLEAMLSGCAPVVADCGGPAMIVTKDCGIKIPMVSPREFIKKIVETVIKLDENRAWLQALGCAANRRVQEVYSEATYAKKLEAAYDLALQTNSSSQ
jgi:glycosyltransferase involved in cell wall biosynthesis